MVEAECKKLQSGNVKDGFGNGTVKWILSKIQMFQSEQVTKGVWNVTRISPSIEDECSRLSVKELDQRNGWSLNSRIWVATSVIYLVLWYLSMWQIEGDYLVVVIGSQTTPAHKQGLAWEAFQDDKRDGEEEVTQRVESDTMFGHQSSNKILRQQEKLTRNSSTVVN